MIVTNERSITVTSNTGPRGYEITIQVHQGAPQSLRRPDAYKLWRYLGLVLGEYGPDAYELWRYLGLVLGEYVPRQI